MKLPKLGTTVDNLKCPKCGKTLGEVVLEAPTGLVNCQDTTCPQKPTPAGG